MLLQDPQKLATVLQLCDANAKDEEFAKLLDDEVGNGDVDGAGDQSDDVLAIARPQLRPDHAVVLQVLGGSVGGGRADFSRKFSVNAGAGIGSIIVSFDNCVHSSGHQQKRNQSNEARRTLFFSFRKQQSSQ